MDFKPMHYLYKSSENPDTITLLLLHGTGGNETDLLQLAESFGKDINVLSLRGNTDENGMPRFFKRLGMGVFDEEDLEFRTHEMVAFIKELAEKEKFDSTKIIALGYSNGANIAGATLFLYPNFLAGAILFRPMMPFKNKKTELNSHNTPVFLSSGKEDSTVNPEETKLYKTLLKDNGFDVTEFILYTGHNLIRQDLDLAVEWFKKIKIRL